MKIYLDLVILINFCYDLLLLMSVSVILKRQAKLYRLIIASLLGTISIVLLFLPINKLVLFFLKILFSVGMIIISFGFKSIKSFINNMMYLYMCSVILGGFLYFLNIEFKTDKFSVNYLVLLIVAPGILYLYYKEHKRFASTYNYNLNVCICFCNGKTYSCSGFVDTGNKLRDPITGKYVIILSRKILVNLINIRSPIYVGYKALNKKGLIECFKIKYIKVNDIILTNYLVGISNDEFNLGESQCLLNYKILEDICLKD